MFRRNKTYVSCKEEKLSLFLVWIKGKQLTDESMERTICENSVSLAVTADLCFLYQRQ